MEKLRTELESLRDPRNQAFVSSLIPNIDPERILGLRSPQLKEIAKRYWKEDPRACRDFLQDVPHRYLEEDMLEMAWIGREKDFPACVQQLESFLPYIDNWAVCDSPLPACFKKNTGELSGYIDKWLDSSHAYTVRYAIGCRMRLYLKEAYEPQQLQRIIALDSGEYYVEMMQAWYLATALIGHPEVQELLKKGILPESIRRKAIRKALESFRIPAGTKESLRALR